VELKLLAYTADVNLLGNNIDNINKDTNKTDSVAFSPQANSTDWATANCWRNLLPTFADRGVSRGQCGGFPKVINLRFLDWSRYFSFK
jgi:hypothetical protein